MIPAALALILAVALVAGCLPEARPARHALRVPSEHYASIQAAVDSAGYGDTVRVAAGVYREHVVMRSGVKLVGEPGAMLDGSDPALERGALWEARGGNGFRTQLGEPYFATNHNLPLLWRDSLLFYRYGSLEDAQSGIAHTPYWSGPIPEGWWAWTDRILTVRSLDSPARHVWHVCPWAEGFYLRQVDDVLIRGFTVRYFRFGVLMAGCQRVSIEDCVFLTPFGVRGGDAPMTEVDYSDPPRPCRDNAIARCVFKSPPAMTYQATKGTWQETAAISVSGSRWRIGGCDVGFNHDGIQCDADSSLIQGCYVHDLSDDGIELDGPGRDMTVRGCRIERTNNAISLAPITVGLTSVEGNSISEFLEQAFKMDPWDSVRVRFGSNVVRP